MSLGSASPLINDNGESEDAYVFSETVEVRDDKGHSLAQTPRKLFVC